MSWYKASGKSSEDIDYSEIGESYVLSVIRDVKTICSNPKIEQIMDSVKDHVHKSEQKVSKHMIGKVLNADVFLVNGNEVKIKFFMDFVEGGNGMIYGKKDDDIHPRFIPDNEIWVDADLDISSFPYVLIHEAVEMYMMKNKKMDYEKAHQKANGIEKHLREKKFFK